jgi:hypothetical protein
MRVPLVATRRAQSLYCAIGLAKRRNKAIAPYACAQNSRPLRLHHERP